MKAPDWYADWRHDAVHELMAKNEAISAEFRINSWPRWDYDLDAATLVFSEAGVAKVRAHVLLIGSTSTEHNNWQWGWANPHWPRLCLSGAESLRTFGEERGIEELSAGWVEDAEDLNSRGWELSAVAARVLDGLGVYRPTTDNGALYFMYRTIGFVA